MTKEVWRGGPPPRGGPGFGGVGYIGFSCFVSLVLAVYTLRPRGADFLGVGSTLKKIRKKIRKFEKKIEKRKLIKNQIALM